jgi:hypothetical protein
MIAFIIGSVELGLGDAQWLLLKCLSMSFLLSVISPTKRYAKIGYALFS